MDAIASTINGIRIIQGASTTERLGLFSLARKINHTIRKVYKTVKKETMKMEMRTSHFQEKDAPAQNQAPVIIESLERNGYEVDATYEEGAIIFESDGYKTRRLLWR